MPVRIRSSILELNQEEATALGHHKSQVCAVGGPFRDPDAARTSFERISRCGILKKQLDWVTSSEQDRGAMM